VSRGLNSNGTPVGQRFGMISVVGETHAEDGVRWLCQCDCGARFKAHKVGLVRGGTTSCGCHRRNRTAAPAGAGIRLWRIWHGMLRRCAEHEGGWDQGNRLRPRIAVCDAWRNYDRFYAWAVSNGYSDNLLLQRLHNDQNYEPGNCVWIKKKVHTHARRASIWIDHQGSQVCLAEAVEELGLDYQAVYNRHVRNGRPFAEVVAALLREQAPDGGG
jgi:hypothetical protein